MKEIKAIIHPTKLVPVVEALHRVGNMPGITVSTVQGYGKNLNESENDASDGSVYTPVEMSKIEAVVPDSLVKIVLETISKTVRTGRVGDGKIFVYDVSTVIKIRTGEKGEKAI